MPLHLVAWIWDGSLWTVKGHKENCLETLIFYFLLCPVVKNKKAFELKKEAIWRAFASLPASFPPHIIAKVCLITFITLSLLAQAKKMVTNSTHPKPKYKYQLQNKTKPCNFVSLEEGQGQDNSPDQRWQVVPPSLPQQNETWEL